MPEADFQPSGTRADAQTIEKMQTFLQDLQNQTSHIRSMCEVLARRVGEDDDDDDLMDFCLRVRVTLTNYLTQVIGLAQTRLREEDLNQSFAKIDRWFDRHVVGTDEYGMFINYGAFNDYINKKLVVCQAFLEEYDMLLTAVPLPTDFSQETIQSIRDELREKMGREAYALHLKREQEGQPPEGERDG